MSGTPVLLVGDPGMRDCADKRDRDAVSGALGTPTRRTTHDIERICQGPRWFTSVCVVAIAANLSGTPVLPGW